MQNQLNDSAAEIQTKLRCASSLVLDLLLAPGGLCFESATRLEYMSSEIESTIR